MVDHLSFRAYQVFELCNNYLSEEWEICKKASGLTSVVLLVPHQRLLYQLTNNNTSYPTEKIIKLIKDIL